ncbi:MAG: c-type cytochrome domain-containing protein, partial [Verrucomicrobiota bacterium]
MRKLPISLACVAALPLSLLMAADFSAIEPLLQEHCVECHAAQDPEGGLVLDSHAGLMKGGETGPAVLPGKGAESLLVRVLEGRWGKTGKNEFMPPGKRPHLKPQQIALIRSWIDEGASPAASNPAPRILEVPRIPPRGTVRHPVSGLAFHAGSRRLAVARTDEVDLVSTETRKPIRSLKGFKGGVYAVAFSPDGNWIFTGGGDATGGEVRRWSVADGTSDRLYAGQRDAVHAVAVSPDGAVLAAGSYDYGIGLWAAADGTERHRIAGSQGAILGLAFRPDGRVLASVGYDRTSKLYDPTTGSRLETLGQALRELNAVAFAPDGKVLLTGGNDNRIRVYRVGTEVREGAVELVDTVFAHEGGLLQVVYSPDGRRVASSGQDRTVKLFQAEGLKPLLTLERQPDWPSALVFAGNDQLVVGRADGTLGFYQASDGKVSPPPKPEVFRTVPRGVQRGVTNVLELLGRNLDRATVLLRYRDGALKSAEALRIEGDSGTLTWAPGASEPPGPWEIAVSDGVSESGTVKVCVDHTETGGSTVTRVCRSPAARAGISCCGRSSTHTFTVPDSETPSLTAISQGPGGSEA